MRCKMWLIGLSLMPVAGVLQGCGGGGGGSSVTVNATFDGTYTTRSVVTKGAVGETSAGSFVVDTRGNLSGNGTDSNGNKFTLTGTVNLANGGITVNGTFADGTTLFATGNLVRAGSTVAGKGTFTVSNGNSGTITITKG